jgi:tight adherence protein C
VTAAVGIGIGFALGVVGFVLGLRRRRLSLEAVLMRLSSSGESSSAVSGGLAQLPNGIRAPRKDQRAERWRVDHKAGTVLAGAIERRVGRTPGLSAKLALVDTTLDLLCGQCVLSALAGFALPGATWVVMRAGGVPVPFVVPVWTGVLTGIVAAAFPVFVFEAQVSRAHRLATRVICSFIDLVVLGLAAGMGIESAMITAAQVGDSDMSYRILHALTASRETGEPPWTALDRLGASLGLEDLCELAATAGMAGNEGAKVRATLAARAASFRRHELAIAESQANAVTDKLFIPGAFLLLGFLLFIGYPAFSRIASGF